MWMVTALHQEAVAFDELFLAGDSCYMRDCFISNDMMREFLLPCYQQLINNRRRHQQHSGCHLHIQIVTDGFQTL